MFHLTENRLGVMFKVIIIGAGLGGLACAIACRRYGLEVIVLEQAPRITPVCSNVSGTSTWIDEVRSARAFKFLRMLLAC